MGTKFRTGIVVAGLGWFMAAGPAAAQESLAGAQALYASAQYEDALSALNRIRSGGVSASDVPAIEQYRALCLLALGRASEAEDAIAAVVTANPTFSPASNDISPRVRSAFTDVRRRVLPAVLQQKYLESKAAFDRKEYRAAGEGFQQLLTVLSDSSVTDLTERPPLSDLKLLAKGFQDLSATALANATPPPAVVRAGPRARARGAGRDAHLHRERCRGHPSGRLQPVAATISAAAAAPDAGRCRSRHRRARRGRNRDDSRAAGSDLRHAGPGREPDLAVSAGDEGRRPGQVPQTGAGQDPTIGASRDLLILVVIW